MPATDAEPSCYALRLLNPYQGTVQVVETESARAISNDGINWRLQLRSAIYKTPWSSLAVPTPDNRYFVYGVWSQKDGLARVPIHPSLYQDHVENTAQHLLQSLARYGRKIPFALRDVFELWLMESNGGQPVALLASQLSAEAIPRQTSLYWQPAQNTDVPFTSEAFAAEQDRATIRGQTQDLLKTVIKQRCKPPFQALWIERDVDGSGTVLSNQHGKPPRRREKLAAVEFPPCLLAEDWPSAEASRLVADYLNWQAPMLLMLPLPKTRRRELERQAQHRPLSVHGFHRLYPEITDQTLLNKILVEAVMRKSS